MTATKPLLFIVEDDVTNLKILENLFKNKYRVIARKSGELAIRYFEKLGFIFSTSRQYAVGEESQQGAAIKPSALPDLILLDIEMPGMDGYGVCEKIKKHPLLADIPVIFISAKMGSEDITKGFDVGAIDYVTKPFKASELKARVKTHVSLKQLQEDLIEKNKLLRLKMKEIEEKTEKLRQKDLELLMMDRIAGIGTLAAGVAHEVNNPLGFVKSSVNALKKTADKLIDALAHWANSPKRDFLLDNYKTYLDDIGFEQLRGSVDRKYDRVDRGIKRIIKIVNSLKSFSLVDREDSKELDINQSIRDAIEILSPRDKTIHFETILDNVSPVVCNASEINQCMIHVIKNAVDAIGHDGRIKIRTLYNKEAKKIHVDVDDNGIGISPEALTRIFHPFFTTKPVGSGTGIGLTLTENIIKRHRGKIDISSREGEGTTVHIVLPVGSVSSCEMGNTA